MNSKPLFAPALVAALVVMFAIQISYAVDSGLLPRFPSPPMPERELNSWRFDSAAWQSNALTAPLALINAEFAPSWSGYALRMSGTNPALASFAFTNLAGGTNLLGSGSVRFWFAPDWSSTSVAGTGPGVDAVLFETGAWSSENGYVRSSLQVDADGDAIRFVLHGTGGPETVLSTSLSWNWNEWHQVALTLSATNTLLYLDGSAAASGNAVAWLPSLVSGRVHGFCVGSDVTGGALAQGNFDELYTFARALSAGEVAFDYNRNSGTAALGPINPEITQPNYSLSFTNVGTNSLTGTSTTNMVASLYGCKLWLEINRLTNSPTNVLVTLHNTVPGKDYQLWSKQQLVATQAGSLEKNLLAATNFICTNIAMNGRSNLFFIVTTTNIGFAGLQFSNTLNAVRPDSMGAVGLEYFVEIVNTAAGYPGVAVYEKCTGWRVDLANATDFFSVQSQGTSYPLGRIADARMLYDHQGQRWVACGLDVGIGSGPRTVILAVSTNSNPLSLTNWTKHVIPVARVGVNADFPTLGLDTNGIYLSIVQISTNAGAPIASNLVVAIRKQELYAGSNITSIMTITGIPPDEVFGVIQPAVNFDVAPRGGYAWFVAKQPSTNSPSYLGGPVAYRRLQWSGTTALWVDTNWVTLTETNYRGYFDLDEGNVLAPQTNSIPAVDLSLTGSRLMMAVIRDGALWTSHHVGLSGTNGTYSGDASGTNVDRSAAQWIKILTDTNGNFASITNGRFYDRALTNAYYYYFPSLMVNAWGDMGIGFSGSRSTEYIGAFYSYRTAEGASPARPLLIHEGENVFGGAGWGDYSYTSLDPIDSCTFWSVQQYSGDNLDENKWGTWIFEFAPKPSQP